MQACGGQRKDDMAFKVNYNQQRMERDRAKAAKKEAKLREKEEEVARRKADRDSPVGTHSETAEGPEPQDEPQEHSDGTP
jgi:hypothetical protein